MALDGVSFNLEKGKTLGIVGESGCGKSTLGKTIVRLHEATSGSVTVKGEDFLKLKGQKLRSARKKIQMIFQDPFASLDPRMTVSNILREPLEIHSIGTKEEREKRVIELLKLVGLRPDHLNRYPHEFSGGQRQRISIARCLALNPEIIVADEPVSALDVSIQAQILNLLKELQDKFNLTLIFISHDLSVVKHMCDDIAVMYLGKVVEHASCEALFSHPTHPYTQALMKSIPLAGKGKKRRRDILKGDVPSPISPPSGCTFHPRCEYAEEKCKIEKPKLESFSDKDKNHLISCLVIKKESLQ